MPLFSYKFYMIFKFNSAKAVLYANNYSKNSNSFYMTCEENEDCNFVSQCLLAGCESMTCRSCDAWFYESEKRYSSSWIHREELFKFLLDQKTCGPFSRLVNAQNLSVGDVVFFIEDDCFSMVGIITKIEEEKAFFVSKKDFGQELLVSNMKNHDKKFVHILGVKK